MPVLLNLRATCVTACLGVLTGACQTTGTDLSALTRPVSSITNIFETEEKLEDTTACSAPRADFEEEVATTQALDSALDAGGTEVQSFLTQLFSTTVATTSYAPLDSALNSNFSEAMSSIGASVRENAERTEAFNAAFNALYDCREAEAARINSDRRNGLLTRAEAEAEMENLRQLLAADIATARQVQANLEVRQEGFKVARDKARARVAEAPTPAERKQRKQEVAELQEEIATNERVYQASVKDVSKAERKVASNSGPFKIAAVTLPGAVIPT